MGAEKRWRERRILAHHSLWLPHAVAALKFPPSGALNQMPKARKEKTSTFQEIKNNNKEK